MSAKRKVFTIEVECREVEADGWVTTGKYWTAIFRGEQPDGVRGCSCGRSQNCEEDAVHDLLLRAQSESRLPSFDIEYRVERRGK